MTETLPTINPDELLTQGKIQGRSEYHAEALEIFRLCKLSKMPEKLGDFIEQNIPVNEAREQLMQLLADRTGTEILSTVSLEPIPQENPVIQAAKARSHMKLTAQMEETLMTVAIEPNNLGDLLKFEAPSLYSREEITVAQGQNLTLGTLVGQESETDLIKALNPAATDGTQNALGALIVEVDATSGNAKAVIITRDAILADHAVVWPSAIALEQKTAAIKQLEARGVIIRKGV